MKKNYMKMWSEFNTHEGIARIVDYKRAMENEKAKKTDTFYGEYSNIVVYEYRGRKYEVEYATCWNYLCTEPYVQHRIEQEKIDEMLDNSKPKTEHRDFDEQMDEVWKMLEWE